MVDAMLAAAAPIDLAARSTDAIDIVGTGGAPSRRAHALNVSTMACFVAAGAGVKVCKHGNRRHRPRAARSTCSRRSASPSSSTVRPWSMCVAEAGVGFCFARAFHPAMRLAGPVRAELGVPTVFNFLGPLSNPARVQRQVIGVSDAQMAPTVIGVLQARGAPRAMVVHGHDGMDELTTTGPSTVHELRDGSVRTYELDPADLGLAVVTAEDVKGGDPDTNAALAKRVFGGEQGPYRDIITLNAAAGLWVAGGVDDLAAGLAQARASIDEGQAQAALDTLIAVTSGEVD